MATELILTGVNHFSKFIGLANQIRDKPQELLEIFTA